MWTTFILIFAAVWLLQIVLAQLQAKHYRQTFDKLRRVTDSGYLGVGVHKPRWGVGSVVILVTDKDMRVLKGVHMTGVTVFTRFKPIDALIGKSLETFTCEANKPLDKATLMAAKRIADQAKKEDGEQDGAQGSPPINAREQAV